jgi:pyruvate ferredoxin oxidoreductase beta subunit
MAAHNIPYMATACIAYPEDFIQKVRSANAVRGLKFIHMLAPCPPGWKFSSEKTIALGRLAVSTGIFPLYEVKEGKYIVKRTENRKPVEEYLSQQGRFKHLSKEEIAYIQTEVDKRYEILLKKEQLL